MANQKAMLDRAEAIDANRRQQIANQSARIAKYVEYLAVRGLLDDFSNWEESTRSS